MTNIAIWLYLEHRKANGYRYEEARMTAPPKNMLWDQGKPEDSVANLSYRLARDTKALVQRPSTKTEEDLRIGFEKLLDPLLAAMGVGKMPSYERSLTGVGRMDAVHGQVVIEYEAPRSFRSEPSVKHAEEQLRGYLIGLANESQDADFLCDPKVAGIGFDGVQIFFLQYRGGKGEAKPDAALFVRQGPYPFDEASARTLLAWLRALPKKLLTPENLADDFGPEGEAAKRTASALVEALTDWADSPRVSAFFAEWKRLFGIVYGEHFGTKELEGARNLANLYDVPPGTEFQTLLFCIHTYFVLLMKLMAAELLTLRERPIASSFCGDLAHARKQALKAALSDIEDGGVYAREGIANFLEGDFFRWYLDAFSPRLEDALRETARALAQYEPETGAFAPAAQRDLLKKLYQYLVPQEIRRNLGEYYTPDWLAELTLDEVKYKGDAKKRLLDPACGSGTFLVLAVARAKQRGRESKERRLSTAKRIVANIWGFDLNPLAVIASRMNYLFALGDLRDELEWFEIPVYLADSILWPEKVELAALDFDGGKTVSVKTAVKEFHVPSVWVEKDGFLMRYAVPLLEEAVRSAYSTEEAMALFRKQGLAFSPHEQAVANFYEELLEVAKENKNGIWARFLKNAFAPRVAGQFDFVVGNPPWIRWQYLSAEYREATLRLWQDYGLFSLKGQAARLGGGEKDFSMLFTYAAIDFYLHEKGTLAFLITQEVFKSKGAGEGFRRFTLSEKRPFRVLKAHDLVAVQPFEGAANKTAMLVAKKSQPTRYPLPYTVWKRKKGVGRIPTDFTLKQALPLLEKRRLIAKPLGKPTGSWQTVPKSGGGLFGIEGENAYQARSGAGTDPYGVFWLQLDAVQSKTCLLVTNQPERGKRQVEKVRNVPIEPDLIFPAVAGANIVRWGIRPDAYVILTQNPETRKPYPESEMKVKWRLTYSYLLRFKEILLSRGSNTIRQLAERTAFYAMFGIGPYTVAPWRVVWKRMASDMVAVVVSQYKTPFGFKTAIGTDTTALMAAQSEPEAHYLCAILNSKAVREFIKSFSSAGRGFGTPSVLKHVGIPKFSPASKPHRELADLSMKCHEAASKGEAEALVSLEGKVDKAAERLFARSHKASKAERKRNGTETKG